jgi:hypothetical protein
MAKKTVTIVEMTDDLDGGKADRTLTFGWDGAMYEIDLSKRNANAFEKAMRPYVDAGRRVRSTGRRPARRAPASKSGTSPDLAAIREWARANGYQVSDRGRISAAVLDAYNVAR